MPQLEESRQAEDGVLPLGTSMTQTSGETIDRMTIAKGTQLTVPISCINRLESIWDPDAREFKPERWMVSIAGLPVKAQEIQGYRHLMSSWTVPGFVWGEASR